MSKAQTITNPELLHNPHAGEMLTSEFMVPLDLDAAALSAAIGVSEDDLAAVIEGHAVISGEMDLRLARYFRMSEGFSWACRPTASCLKPSAH